MRRLKNLYVRYQNFIENILFAALLIVYPLIRVNQGIDVADTAYSLANFEFFPSMDGTWIIATFLSNVVGNLLTKLPFGDMMLGMYCYTALIQSLTAVGVYFVLKRKIAPPLVFLGEMIALGLCWCPSVILYNYLTYLFMTAGILLLYYGILRQNRRLYFAAGICLGVNVAVRMPNVTQAAFIIAVWYGCVLFAKKEDSVKKVFNQCLRDTLWCICGYLSGFGVFLIRICLRYGVSAYPDMVRTMFAMTDQAVDYKPTAMLTGMFGDYLAGLKWLFFAGLCIAAGLILFKVQQKLFPENRTVSGLCKTGYVAVLLVLLRFYWGRGMFNFMYDEYRSMYYPTVLLLLLTIGAALYCLVKRSIGNEQKVLAALVLIQIFVTPLGSNNLLYPIINNLFIAVPFVLWAACGWLAGKRTSFAVKAPLVVLGMFVLIQSIGFHLNFAFVDSNYPKTRDAAIEHPAKAAGIYTNQQFGEGLEELAVYMETEGLIGREAIFYRDVPGLGYLFDMPSALSTFWLDLDSYLMEEFERDMNRIETENIYKWGDYPPVIASTGKAGAESAASADWWDIEAEKDWYCVGGEHKSALRKRRILDEFMKEYDYEVTFSNGDYVVFRHCNEN